MKRSEFEVKLLEPLKDKDEQRLIRLMVRVGKQISSVLWKQK